MCQREHVLMHAVLSEEANLYKKEELKTQLQFQL